MSHTGEGDLIPNEIIGQEWLAGHPISCSIPSVTRVWINRPNVAKPREQQGQHPIFDVLLPDGRQLLVWGVQWAGLTTMMHKLDHAIMGKRAVAWIETSANVFLQLSKDGPFEDARGV